MCSKTSVLIIDERSICVVYINGMVFIETEVLFTNKNSIHLNQQWQYAHNCKDEWNILIESHLLRFFPLSRVESRQQ